MLYPTLESIHHPELTKYHELLTDTVSSANAYNVNVTDHNRVEAPSETFIVYKILTEYKYEVFTAYRRYSDFEWLLKILCQSYPYHILPPMPPKRFIATIDKFSRPFIDKRQVSLSIMMRRLCNFKDCMEDARSQVFLKQDQKEFDRYRAIHKNPSWFFQLRVSFKEIYSGSLLNLGSNNEWRDGTTTSYMKSMKDRVHDRTLLKSILQSIEIMFEKWEDYSFSMLWLAQDLADLVLLMDKSDLSAYLDGGAQLFFNLSTEGKSHYNFLAATIQPMLNEYVTYNDLVIKLIKERNRNQRAYHSKAGALKLLEAQHHSCDRNDMPKGNKVDQLIKERVSLEDNLRQYDEVFMPGLSSWQHQRSKDIALCLNVIVTSNLKYHRASLDLCKHVLLKVHDDVFH